MSLPEPVVIVSFPAPPFTTLVPSPASMVSSPFPPVIVSVPEPDTIVSFPPRPSIVFVPPVSMIRSSPSVPMMLSLPEPRRITFRLVPLTVERGVAVLAVVPRDDGVRALREPASSDWRYLHASLRVGPADVHELDDAPCEDVTVTVRSWSGVRLRRRRGA